MTRYLSEEEPTGKITITHEEAMRELGKIEDDYSEIRNLPRLTLCANVRISHLLIILKFVLCANCRAGKANRWKAHAYKRRTNCS